MISYKSFYSLLAAFLIGVFMASIFYNSHYQAILLTVISALIISSSFYLKKYLGLILLPVLMLGFFYYGYSSDQLNAHIFQVSESFAGEVLVSKASSFSSSQ